MKIDYDLHRFEPNTSLVGIHRYTHLTVNRLLSIDSDHSTMQARHRICGNVEQKPILTTLWLCTMATGKGQGTQNWSHTEAYDDGP
jgi:hypothetical protein